MHDAEISLHVIRNIHSKPGNVEKQAEMFNNNDFKV
jgi:hypothetical protein